MGPMRQLECERRQLDNGLTVLISENRRLPLVSLNAYVLAGANQNPMDRPGLAALTVRLLDEGTVHYTPRQMARLVEGIGGGLSTFSQREISGAALNLESDDLDTGFELLSEIICRPIFPADRFRLEREKLLNQLRGMADDPQLVASNILSRAVYDATTLQFPVLGTLHSVRRAAVEEVRLYHREKYVPQDAILVVVGDVCASRVQELAERHFCAWSGATRRRDEVPPLHRQTLPARHHLKMSKEQVHLYLGHLGISRSHPDFHVLQVMDVILGSGPGFTSRIPRKLRDEQGLAYTTYADISSSAGIHPGRFVAYISTSPDNLAAAEEGLLAELEAFRADGPSEDELAMAQDFLTGSFVFDFQSNADVARFLLLTQIFNLGADYPQKYLDMIRSVTVGDVTRVAREHLDTINYTRVAVGPL